MEGDVIGCTGLRMLHVRVFIDWLVIKKAQQFVPAIKVLVAIAFQPRSALLSQKLNLHSMNS
jgi:hypothetical protein